MSLLDGFSGYNQVSVRKSDKQKNTFTTKWGSYTFSRMPFMLINAGAIFQRAMHIVFYVLIGFIILIYLDELAIFSKEKDDHFAHLREVFIHCRKYDITLNHSKSIF